MKEIIGKRTVNSKTYALGNDKYQYTASIGPRHYLGEDGKLHDILLSCRDDRNDFLVDNAPHTIRISKSSPAYRYTGRSGTVSVELIEINGRPIPRRSPVKEKIPAHFRSMERILWRSIALDTDYEIIPTVSGCATNLILHSENAPRKWRWKITGDDLLQPIIGWDKNHYPLELIYERSGEFLDVTWTGVIFDRKRLRQGNLLSNLPPAYPVTIDPTVNENIPSGADDADSNNFGFSNSGINLFAGFSSAPGSGFDGLRFTTIAIPQGASISSATFTIDINLKIGVPVVYLYADAADNPGQFGTADLIRNITKTSAFAIITNPVGNGFTFSATGVIQEIISRSGWSSNNAMRFGGFNQAGTGATNSFLFAAFEHTVDTEARLDITYTLSAFIPRAMIF